MTYFQCKSSESYLALGKGLSEAHRKGLFRSLLPQYLPLGNGQ